MPGEFMLYNKPPLSFPKQADLLIFRGLRGEKNKIISKLEDVNYYRLSTYLYPFRLEDDSFKEGTHIDTIWAHYTFDRQLRLILMDAIERIEVSIKTQTTNFITCTHNTPFPHKRHENYDNDSDLATLGQLIHQIRQNASRSKEPFIKHYQKKYKEEADLPLWIATEVMTFGNIFTLYSNLKKHDQKSIALYYGVAPKIFHSWLQSINYVRNLCAHHSRIWNRDLAIKPLIPRKDTLWMEPINVLLYQGKIFSVLTVLKYLLDIVAPQSNWAIRFKSLLSKYQELPLNWMGMPENWIDCLIWKERKEKELGYDS